jgi:hypothetical protein
MLKSKPGVQDSDEVRRATCILAFQSNQHNIGATKLKCMKFAFTKIHPFKVVIAHTI